MWALAVMEPESVVGCERLQIVMSNPQAVSHPPICSGGSVTEAACGVQTIVGDLPIQDIQYAEGVRNALIVLGSGVTRHQLESLQPDLQRMLCTLSKTQLNGVMVTCQGQSAPAVWSLT